MKKKSFIVLTVITVCVLIIFFSCNPFSQTGNKNAAANLNVLDETGSSRLVVNTTIIVNGTTYNGNGIVLDTSPLIDPGEEQLLSPVFSVTNGTVRNVTINPNMAITCFRIYSNCTIDNVTVNDITEDFLKVTKAGVSTISNITANNSPDKVFQVNDMCTIFFSNIVSNNFSKLIRQNGGTSWKATFYINVATLTGVSECIGRSDSSSTVFYYRNITCNLPESSWFYTGTTAKPY